MIVAMLLRVNTTLSKNDIILFQNTFPPIRPLTPHYLRISVPPISGSVSESVPILLFHLISVL